MSGGASREVLEDVQDADWLPDGSRLAVSHYANGRYQLEFPIGTVVYGTSGWISDVRVSGTAQDLFKGGLAISGIYDLRPMVQVDWLNPDLRLDEDSAFKASPAFLPPATRAPVMTCVGGGESFFTQAGQRTLSHQWK